MPEKIQNFIKKIKVTPHHQPEDNIKGKKTIIYIYNNRLEYKINFEQVITDEEFEEFKDGVEIHVDEEGFIFKQDISSIFKYIDNHITQDTNIKKPVVEICYKGNSLHFSCSSTEERDSLYRELKNWATGEDTSTRDSKTSGDI